MKRTEDELQFEEDNVQGSDKVKAVLREFFQMIVIPVALALFCGKVLIVNANIPSGSMENTIHPGDRVIGSRLAYLGKEPQREDIIIFRFPDDESQIFIKRIIGLPGEISFILCHIPKGRIMTVLNLIETRRQFRNGDNISKGHFRVEKIQRLS